jgi:prophage antirepressor-like protein|nr:MAG TPA: antirepressor [Caudoviricetes sp.]
MELQIFSNEEFGEVRMTEIDGKPYFVATDVATALGYINPRKAVNDHCKGGNET